MKNTTSFNRTITVLFIFLIPFSLNAQTTKENPIKYYQDCITNKTSPTEHYTYKYNDSDRVIVWNDKPIRNYKYTNEQFDNLGYDYVKTTTGDNNKYSTIYRSCEKGIIIEVTEWYNVKLSISMNWYAKSIRKGIGYLMYCDISNQNKEIDYKKLKEDLNNSLLKDAIKESNLKKREEIESNHIFTQDEIINCISFLGNNNDLFEYYKSATQRRFTIPIIINKDSSITILHDNFYTPDSSALKKILKFNVGKVIVESDTFNVNTSLSIHFMATDREYTAIENSEVEVKVRKRSKEPKIKIISVDPSSKQNEIESLYNFEKLLKDKSDGSYDLFLQNYNVDRVSIFSGGNGSCNEFPDANKILIKTTIQYYEKKSGELISLQ